MYNSQKFMPESPLRFLLQTKSIEVNDIFMYQSWTNYLFISITIIFRAQTDCWIPECFDYRAPLTSRYLYCYKWYQRSLTILIWITCFESPSLIYLRSKVNSQTICWTATRLGWRENYRQQNYRILNYFIRYSS